MNVGSKIPNIPNSIFLSTLKEVKNFTNANLIKDNILSFAKEDNFEQFIVKVLAAQKIGNKPYSELIFSVDPGTKHLGLVVFLDDYYLNSHTIFENKELINKIQIYINALKEGNQYSLKLLFKFGTGILPITLKVIEQIFNTFNEERLKVKLINESRTSKYKIRDETKKKIPKDEASALIISLREGIEINNENYTTVIQQLKSRRKRSEESYVKYPLGDKKLGNKLIEVVEDILRGIVSLSKSMELLNIGNNIR